MNRLNPFRFEMLCAISIIVTIWGGILDAASFTALAVCWLGYVVVFAGVAVAREGLRGLVGPTLMLAIMAVVRAQLVPLFVGVWFLCALFYVGRALVRRLRPENGHTAVSRQQQKPDEMQSVAIAVPMPGKEVNAQDVLADFGFNSGARDGR